ncbi:hypothetical protein [Paracandidimonas soli]|nr:hypothetical protein [Paracandidimonas soli]
MPGESERHAGREVGPQAKMSRQAASQRRSVGAFFGGRMSLYKKAWIFAIWTFVVLLTFPYWLPLFQKLLGPFGTVAGIFFWLGHGVASMVFFSCPDCGLSAFQGSQGFFTTYAPWPRRKCGHCGHDHVRMESSSQR